MKCYLVGGAVRDRLLGRQLKDRDWVVVGSTAEEMLAQGFKSVGKDFPVFLHPDTGEEYALARTERKTAVGYHGFEFFAAPEVSLEQDLARRDLTINALAEDENGKIIDYYGGLQDLERGILRHVSPAFSEDPVRILRVARFAARYAHRDFRIADETVALMREMVTAGEVDALVVERVWQEMEAALGEQDPQVFIQVLRDCGALAILFPELEALFGVPQPEKYHPEIDCGIHTVMVLKQATRLSDDKAMRFAALMHDLGKGVTPKTILPHHYGHEKAGVELIEALCERYRVPKRWRDLAVLTSAYHTHVHKLATLKNKTVLKVLDACDAFRRPERFAQLLLACKADSRGRTGYEESVYPQQAQLMQILEALLTIDVKAIVAKGFKGVEIRDELRRERLRMIAQLRKQQKQPQT